MRWDETYFVVVILSLFLFRKTEVHSGWLVLVSSYVALMAASLGEREGGHFTLNHPPPWPRRSVTRNGITMSSTWKSQTWLFMWTASLTSPSLWLKTTRFTRPRSKPSSWLELAGKVTVVGTPSPPGFENSVLLLCSVGGNRLLSESHIPYCPLLSLFIPLPGVAFLGVTAAARLQEGSIYDAWWRR